MTGQRRLVHMPGMQAREEKIVWLQDQRLALRIQLTGTIHMIWMFDHI